LWTNVPLAIVTAAFAMTVADDGAVKVDPLFKLNAPTTVILLLPPVKVPPANVAAAPKYKGDAVGEKLPAFIVKAPTLVIIAPEVLPPVKVPALRIVVVPTDNIPVEVANCALAPSKRNPVVQYMLPLPPVKVPPVMVNPAVDDTFPTPPVKVPPEMLNPAFLNAPSPALKVPEIIVKTPVDVNVLLAN